jgi:predicted lysophospholipase L1 biosynthesis ABC-type transport system permease subunit
LTRAWLGVVVFVGLFGGIVTAAAAGARRTDDAYSRFVVASHGAPYLIDDFIPNPDAAVLDPGTLAALPAIAEADSFRVSAHETSVAALEYSLARLRPGMAAAAQHQVEALGRGQQAGVQQLGDQARDVNRSIRLVAVALWLLAGLLLVVAVLVLGQLLARQIALDASDYPVLHTLGMTRRQLAGLAVARGTAIGAAGGALAVGVAIALSPLTPIGLARTAEPAPGFACDTLVLVTAVAGTTAIAAILASWPGVASGTNGCDGARQR